MCHSPLLRCYVAIIPKLKSWIIVTMLCSHAASGQVANNNINARTILHVDEIPTPSYTGGATVEWNCINKALTNKCLSYHNDQWFTFSVETEGTYFLNVSTKSCREDNGIQAIVIEGDPCLISTYKILHCIPRIRQEEIYIELDNLKANVPYLVNIDGFLGDQCGFDIQFSSTAKGFSHRSENLDTLGMSAHSDKGIATLAWRLPDGLAGELYSFEVYRYKTQKKPLLIRTVPVDLNSLGAYRDTYSITDTLPDEGRFNYEIVGLLKGGRKEILDRQQVGFKPLDETVLNFSLDYKDGARLQILLIDDPSGNVLRQFSTKYNKVLDTQKTFSVGEFVKDGMSNFTVRVIELKSGRKKDHFFRVSPDGKVFRD